MTILDPVLNFGLVTVSTGYTNADAVIILAGGEGAKLPDPAVDGPYNLTWWNASGYGNPSQDANVEIVRVTNKTADTLTVVRAQEGTTATNKNTAFATYMMSLSLTKKTWEDILPLIGLPVSTDTVVTYSDTHGEVDTVTFGGITYTCNRDSSGKLLTITYLTKTITLNRDAYDRVISFTLT